MREIKQEEYDAFIEAAKTGDMRASGAYVFLLENVVKPHIKHTCAGYAMLRGTGYEDEIYVDVMKIVTRHFVHKFIQGNTDDFVENHDAKQFKAWLIKIIKNRVYTYNAMQLNNARRTVFMDDERNPVDLYEKGDVYANIFGSYGERATDRIQNAMDEMIRSKFNISTIIAWLNYVCMLVKNNTKRTQTSNELIELYGKNTLREMLDNFVRQSSDIEWLSLTKEQTDCINKRLNRICKATGKTFAESTLESFYMKKGAKATLSDWISGTIEHFAEHDQK